MRLSPLRSLPPLAKNFNPRTPCGVRLLGGLDIIGVRGAISIHAPRVGCDGCQPGCQPGGHNFNPRTPCGVRRWACSSSKMMAEKISIHAPRVGCDLRLPHRDVQEGAFQSTHPVWGATVWYILHEVMQKIFQSTHPVWGATGSVAPTVVTAKISIHAPRVGCDAQSRNLPLRQRDFNPRTPCGVRQYLSTHPIEVNGFQSTHPVWGATMTASVATTGTKNFNPRTPCGVRRHQLNQRRCYSVISIHAPRVGCDGMPARMPARRAQFQSTHPVWGATAAGPSVQPGCRISIHAPRVGCDLINSPGGDMTVDFNPRTPCGVRRSYAQPGRRSGNFNPRTPCGVRLGHNCNLGRSTHNFNPRTPCGVRPSAHRAARPGRVFQSTHPVWGATG